MARIIVITNPAHDKATQYLNSWSNRIIACIKNLPFGTNIFELKDSNVTREKLHILVEEKDPHLILFNGHGTSKSIFGFKSDILVKCGENEALLVNKIIHSLSCDSGKELGPKCISLGTKAYIGYKEEFKFCHMNKDTESEQYSDPLANLFLRPAFEISKALLEGETAQEAYKRSQGLYLDNIRILLTSADPDLNTIYAGRVLHDMHYQVFLGDPNAFF